MKRIAAAALMALAITTAEAQSQLTLACTGTTNGTMSAEKLNVGLNINFQTKQVIGFGPGWEADITVGETAISFFKLYDDGQTTRVIVGTIDRVTGSVTASVAATIKNAIDGKPERVMSRSYDLSCKPAQRLF